jgi:pyruvate/2-oxoglutarate dehydrogenase complex dihydrolipoamide dehydrogenase (E3) component/uncharacterized membrane protein YdjX (TVP38/TMEM64 family)
MNKNRYLTLFALCVAIAAIFLSGVHESLTLAQLKAQHAGLTDRVAAAPYTSAIAFFLVYVVATGLSVPGAALLTVAGGAVFGFWWGLLLVSFASTLGATLAFLASRYFFRAMVQSRFGDRLNAVNAGFARDGAFYLLTLRLIPLFPFFAVNLLMGLTTVRTWTYFWVSQVGMLAGTAVYVYAGTELGRIDSLRSIATPGLLVAFTLLGLFPLIARGVVRSIEARRVYAPWTKPATFDRNLVVIGGGSAGLVSAYIAAAVKSRVTLVEQNRMGGDCLNTGCVPSKALIRATRLLADIRDAGQLGIRSQAEADFPAIMQRIRNVIRQIEPHDSVERYTTLGVECLKGHARITSPWTVDIHEGDSIRTLTTRSIIIATGARPFIPPIPGIEIMDCLTSDSVWDLDMLPGRLLVLGGGPIGCELAQAFSRLGSHVTVIEMASHLMPREDSDVAAYVENRFRNEDIDVLTGHRAMRFAMEAGEKVMYSDRAGTETRVTFDRVLCALGRAAETSGYGLDALGIPLSASRTIEVNEFMQTRYPNIYACGDVAGPYQFTHTAAHTAWYAAVNALFSPLKRFRADFSVIPWATFTDPEVARVGISEDEARARGIPHEVTCFDAAELDRAIADGRREGMVKVLTVPGKDRILGATIVGEHAGERIIEFVSAMRSRTGLNRILGTIHIYPTWVEANKYAAGEWKRAHAPAWALDMADRFHRWRRT